MPLLKLMRNVTLTILGSWILIQYGHPMVEQYFLHTIIYIRARSQAAEECARAKRHVPTMTRLYKKRENEVKSQRNAREEAKKERDNARRELKEARAATRELSTELERQKTSFESKRELQPRNILLNFTGFATRTQVPQTALRHLSAQTSTKNLEY